MIGEWSPTGFRSRNSSTEVFLFLLLLFSSVLFSLRCSSAVAGQSSDRSRWVSKVTSSLFELLSCLRSICQTPLKACLRSAEVSVFVSCSGETWQDDKRRKIVSRLRLFCSQLWFSCTCTRYKLSKAQLEPLNHIDVNAVCTRYLYTSGLFAGCSYVTQRFTSTRTKATDHLPRLETFSSVTLHDATKGMKPELRVELSLSLGHNQPRETPVNYLCSWGGVTLQLKQKQKHMKLRSFQTNRNKQTWNILILHTMLGLFAL